MSGGDDVDVGLVIEVLREVGPHGVGDDPRTEGLDIFTYFAGRDLRRRDFSGIEHGLTLSFAEADLRQADLRGIHLHDADLRDADLRGADARGGRIRANLSRAQMTGLRLDDARLERCSLARTAPDVARSEVASCVFVEVDLAYTRFSGRFFGGELSDCDLTGFGGEELSISGTWTRCELSELYLPRVRTGTAWLLVESHGERVGLPDASLDSVEILECRLPALQADRANLARSIIVGTEMHGASLRGADLSGADLERVSLIDADLRGVTFEGASFDEVDLTGAKLDPGALDSLSSARNIVDPRGNPR